MCEDEITAENCERGKQEEEQIMKRKTEKNYSRMCMDVITAGIVNEFAVVFCLL